MDSKKGWTGREDEIIEEEQKFKDIFVETQRNEKWRKERNFRMKTNYNFIKLLFNRTLEKIMDQNNKILICNREINVYIKV